MNGKKFSLFQNSFLEVYLMEPADRRVQNLGKQPQDAVGETLRAMSALCIWESCCRWCC